MEYDEEPGYCIPRIKHLRDAEDFCKDVLDKIAAEKIRQEKIRFYEQLELDNKNLKVVAILFAIALLISIIV